MSHSRQVLDDFTRRRLSDLPKLHELHAQAGAVEWYTRLFHEARPACARAARWLNITPPRRHWLPDDDPDATVVPIGKSDL